MPLTPYGQGNQSQPNAPGSNTPGVNFLNDPEMNYDQAMQKWREMNESLREVSTESWGKIKDVSEKSLLGMIDATERSYTRQYEYQKSKLEAMKVEYEKLVEVGIRSYEQLAVFNKHINEQISQVEKKHLADRGSEYKNFFGGINKELDGLGGSINKILGSIGLPALAVGGAGAMAFEMAKYFDQQYQAALGGMREYGAASMAGVVPVAGRGPREYMDFMKGRGLVSQSGFRMTEQESNIVVNALMTQSTAYRHDPAAALGMLQPLALSRPLLGMGGQQIAAQTAELSRMYGMDPGAGMGTLLAMRERAGSEDVNLPQNLYRENVMQLARTLRAFNIGLEGAAGYVEKFGDKLREGVVTAEQLAQLGGRGLNRSALGSRAYLAEQILQGPASALRSRLEGARRRGGEVEAGAELGRTENFSPEEQQQLMQAINRVAYGQAGAIAGGGATALTSEIAQDIFMKLFGQPQFQTRTLGDEMYRKAAEGITPVDFTKYQSDVSKSLQEAASYYKVTASWQDKLLDIGKSINAELQGNIAATQSSGLMGQAVAEAGLNAATVLVPPVAVARGTVAAGRAVGGAIAGARTQNAVAGEEEQQRRMDEMESRGRAGDRTAPTVNVNFYPGSITGGKSIGQQVGERIDQELAPGYH